MLKITGHRGARGLAPENTVAAIRKALAAKVDEIEIDVRVSQDGVPVVNHDSDVHDQTTARLPVHHHSYAELKQHKPDLATLEEAIEAIDRRVPLLIELKSGEAVVPVVRTIQLFLTKGWLETDFLLGSKSQRTLRALHRALPALPVVVIEPFSGIRAAWRARQLGTRRLSMQYWWLWRGFIGTMTRRGYEVHAYTVNNPSHARRLAKSGLAGVVTDRPDLYAG